MTPLLVALGAAIGAPLRYALASALDAERFPRGTLLVNVVGSFLLGLLVGAGATGHWLALLGTGFCGGLHDVLRVRGADPPARPAARRGVRRP